MAARALARALEHSPDGITVPLGAFAGQLGLGGGTGRHSKVISRALGRLVDFDMAVIAGDELAMRRHFPPLARRHIMRLPAHLAAVHQTDLDRMAHAKAASR